MVVDQHRARIGIAARVSGEMNFANSSCVNRADPGVSPIERICVWRVGVYIVCRYPPGARAAACRPMARMFRGVAARFDHIRVHEDAWSKVQPASSTAPHLFLKAAQLAEEKTHGPSPLLKTRHYRLASSLRQAFFEQARDIATWEVQADCAATLGLDPAAIEARMHSGEAAALLDRDIGLAQALKVTGSPTFVMNEGRQTLYGNVGFHLLEANLEELLRAPGPGEASWC